MAKTLTKEQIIEQVKKKFYSYLYHVDVIGGSCMYVADLLKIFKKTKSNSQIYRDMQKLTDWNILGEFNREGKKIIYIKRLGNRILGKENLKELRKGTEKLEMSSIRTELFLLGEEFFFRPGRTDP